MNLVVFLILGSFRPQPIKFRKAMVSVKMNVVDSYIEARHSEELRILITAENIRRRRLHDFAG